MDNDHEEIIQEASPDIQSSNDGRKDETLIVSRSVQSVLAFAALVATILTLWNPRSVFRPPDIYNLLDTESPAETIEVGHAPIDEEIQIGLLAGHWQNSTGEVCADGIIEADVNHEIATRLQRTLEADGFSVRVFPEFDLDLLQYKADVFIAIYSGSCLLNPPAKSSFKIGTSLISDNQIAINSLAVCLTESYQEYTQLPFNYLVIDEDHPAFHIFRDIDPDTPAVMIEIGSLSADRHLITAQTDILIKGLTTGIECFLSNRDGVTLE